MTHITGPKRIATLIQPRNYLGLPYFLGPNRSRAHVILSVLVGYIQYISLHLVARVYPAVSEVAWRELPSPYLHHLRLPLRIPISLIAAIHKLVSGDTVHRQRCECLDALLVDEASDVRIVGTHAACLPTLLQKPLSIHTTLLTSSERI